MDGKIAVVTGGSRGIGLDVARGLLEAGARVTIGARSESELANAVRSLGSAAEVTASSIDVSSADDVARLFSDVVDRHQAVDILVCAHGVLQGGYSLLDYPLETWEETFAVNARGTFLCGQAAARLMVDRGCEGRIVNITSVSAVAAAGGSLSYDASKAAVASLTRGMALHLAEHRITVNAVAPGWTRTPMTEPYLTDDLERSCNPLGRVGEPEDVTGAVLWLVNPATRQVTGTTIFVDGGQHAALSGGPRG